MYSIEYIACGLHSWCRIAYPRTRPEPLKPRLINKCAENIFCHFKLSLNKYITLEKGCRNCIQSTSPTHLKAPKPCGVGGVFEGVFSVEFSTKHIQVDTNRL